VAQVVPHQRLQGNNKKMLISSLNAPSYSGTTPKLVALPRAEIFPNALFSGCGLILVGQTSSGVTFPNLQT